MKRYRLIKRALGLCLGVAMVFQMLAIPVMAADYWPEGIDTISPSAIVMEMNTGTVLYEKNRVL